MRRQIIKWLKDRSNFPASLPEHANLDGVCVSYIQEKAGLSQSTISNYMGVLKKAGLVTSERMVNGRFISVMKLTSKHFSMKLKKSC
ncbi:ArsR family transcriptional regulator [Psychrobacter sp. BI730]|uniref:ArsR/SmtB family transcription factor n=1 Tax=Psychrobacter sp. BI730 TaxID=2705463 RepID=UPI00211CF258|nr:ArsR family transcriptional regulator [Psychrobacter sp. BI730]